MSPEGTKYCYITRPDQPKSEYPQHSMCQFPDMEDADAGGVWHVVTGIDGHTEETKFEVIVEPKGISL